MKAIPCILILHGQVKQHDAGDFLSISKAKKYVSDLDWERTYTIIRLSK